LSTTDEKKPGGRKISWQSDLGRSSSFLGFGVQLAGTMLFYVVAGYLLDRWLGTEPWLIIAGAVLGMVAFFIQLSRIARRLSEDSERRRKEHES
jgi:ATP synthase protein I